jgi:hypothetical protein
MATTGNSSRISVSDRHGKADQSWVSGILHHFCACLSRAWRCTLQFALVLWVTRVPFSTTAIGLLLFGLAPQVQDLFIEFTRKAPLPWLPFVFVPPGRAIAFLLILIAGWALPTHYTARLLLDTDDRLCERLENEENLRRRKLRAEVLTEEAAREPLCLHTSSVWVPRILGLLTFVAVLIAILRSKLNLPDLQQQEVTLAADRALAEMAALVVLTAAGFLFYVVCRPRRADLPVLRGFADLNRKIAWFWRAISPDYPHGASDQGVQDVGRFILLGMFVIFLLIFACGADTAAWLFPRVMAVPFILGGWLPFVSYLSGWGRQWRAPLITLLALLVAALALLLGDNHSVRLIDADAAAGKHVGTAPMSLQEAVVLWMKENQCEPINGSEARPACPRPIIISSEGGASRAGFFMASIIGYFMQKDEAAARALTSNDVRNRLFAISSVSGGSMGAVMVTAALNAQADSNDIPCTRTAVDQWWGETVNNWRDCFEALTSGDFLTADFFGFTFNDMLPFGPWRDRATVLEDSWRDRYKAVVTNPDESVALPACQGLECPFLALRPQPGHWIPLLILNGTSEKTGGRIVTTPLAKTYAPSEQVSCPNPNVSAGCQLFIDAGFFHDLLEQRSARIASLGWVGALERYWLRKRSDDVRLSTAALNSARFPLISPPGSVRNHEGGIVDRIVDGGYFESYGAVGAKELALAVHAVQPSLTPLVIVISNDPNDLLDPSDDVEWHQHFPSPPVAQGEVLTELTAPITTFTNARTARGILAVEELRSTLHAAMSCKVLVVQIRVWPDNGKDLSMSWWESPLVQRQLHRQTEDDADQNQNGPHLNAIWQQMKTPTCN